MASEVEAAIAEYETAARRTTTIPEQHYLTVRAAQLNERRREARGGRRYGAMGSTIRATKPRR